MWKFKIRCQREDRVAGRGKVDTLCLFQSFYIIKGNRILRYGCRAFDTFWVPDDIESCNFQNLLIFGFHETSQNLMSFRQLLFSLFHGGDQRKKSENPRKVSNVRHPYLRILFPFLRSLELEHHITPSIKLKCGNWFVIRFSQKVICTLEFEVQIH